MPNIFWFRRDLRLRDNVALAQAASQGPVVPVFIFSKELGEDFDRPRIQYLVSALNSLNDSIEGSLVIRFGDPCQILEELCSETGSNSVFATKSFSTYRRKEDKVVSDFLEQRDIDCTLTGSPYAVEPGSIFNKSGSPYKVFTPFFRAWKEYGWDSLIESDSRSELPQDRDSGLPHDRHSGLPHDRHSQPPQPRHSRLTQPRHSRLTQPRHSRLTQPRHSRLTQPRHSRLRSGISHEWFQNIASEQLPKVSEFKSILGSGGEPEAHDRLDKFLNSAVSGYKTQRDLPAVDGTSLLSHYLKWGVLHPRQILDRLGPSPAEDVFRSEICWREFYADVLFHRPETATEAFSEKMAKLRTDSGPETDNDFNAWCSGKTGFPIVDAGMRQLVSTGWMHNRVRMIVASFLTKDLHLDWQRGADFFMHHLADGDLASNSHGWQWTAGTGTDASPYFRVFNQTTQSKKFDPAGTYLREWIPEIAHLSDKHIHEPWKDPHGAPAGYPLPIVDHSEERLEALARYEEIRS